MKRMKERHISFGTFPVYNALSYPSGKAALLTEQSAFFAVDAEAPGTAFVCAQGDDDFITPLLPFDRKLRAVLNHRIGGFGIAENFFTV